MTSTIIPICNIVCALNCEARPIIDYYQLKRAHDIKSFETYSNKENTIYLVVCGIGKMNAATATTFIQMLSGNHSHASVINLGIAGANDLDIDLLVVANKIQAQLNEKQVYYPFARYLKNIKPFGLLSCDAPQQDYPDNMMVDMESVGFFHAALKFVALEQIQVLKVISDNKHHSWENITAKTVQKSIEKNVNPIADAIEAMLLLSSNEINATHVETDIDAFLTRWHFTFYQETELKKLLRAWAINKNKSAIEFCHFCKNAEEVILLLRESESN